ncbi:MAG TPA: glycosyltransferase family 39 protein [Myxococcales bacterium]|nr:glycosyltransferase family 39 protein [Myxococcales bacterium]
MRDASNEPHAWVWSPRTALALAFFVRVAVFPFAWNLYGDAPSRVVTVLDWLAHPFFLRSFRGARQFGPLNVYLLAAVEWLWPDRFVAPRLLSLVAGTLTAWPLYRLAERRFGRRAAALSTWAFAVYGLHVQASTTAASEALFLLPLLWGLVALDRAADRPRWLAVAGFALACASAIRYDGWLYAPLSWLWLVQPLREKRLRPAHAALFAAATLAVPAFLMWGNWVDMGDPLYLVHYIDADHVKNALRASAAMGRARWTLYCLLFWPANLALELTPFVAAGILLALLDGLRRRRRALDLAAIALTPAAFFTFRGAFLLQFHPLARFTLPTAVLLLPYAGAGLELLWVYRPQWPRIGLQATAAATALALPAYLAWRTEGRGDAWADTLRPISPVSNLPPDLEAAAAELGQAAGAGPVLVDESPGYEDIAVAFYVPLPLGKVLSLRRPEDMTLLTAGAPPAAIAALEGGGLASSGLVRRDGDALAAFGRHYRLIRRVGRVAIYAVGT